MQESVDVVLGNVFTWLLLGAAIGLFMHLIDKQKLHGGIMVSLLTGITGSAFGGFLAALIFGFNKTPHNRTILISAIVTGLLLVIWIRTLYKEKKFHKLNMFGRQNNSTV